MKTKSVKPRFGSWDGESSEIVPITVSVREYAIRLEQLARSLYEELRQLSSSSSSPDEKPSSPPLSEIHATPVNLTGPGEAQALETITHGKSGRAA